MSSIVLQTRGFFNQDGIKILGMVDIFTVVVGENDDKFIFIDEFKKQAAEKKADRKNALGWSVGHFSEKVACYFAFDGFLSEELKAALRVEAKKFYEPVCEKKEKPSKEERVEKKLLAYKVEIINLERKITMGSSEGKKITSEEMVRKKNRLKELELLIKNLEHPSSLVLETLKKKKELGYFA